MVRSISGWRKLSPIPMDLGGLGIGFLSSKNTALICKGCEDI